MKKKTYNNVCKAAKMIMKKGYDEKTAFDLSKKCFDNAEANKRSGFPVEWYIDKIIPAEEFKQQYRQ